MSRKYKSCKDFEESISEIFKCLEYIIYIILDFEETDSEDLKEIEENYTGN